MADTFFQFIDVSNCLVLSLHLNSIHFNKAILRIDTYTLRANTYT